MTQEILQNAALISSELDWLEKVLETRLKLFFNSGSEYPDVTSIPVPDLSQESGPYAHLVNSLGLGPAERLIILLALAPHLRPEALDLLFSQNSAYNRPFTIFGGTTSAKFPGFLPTHQTAFFLLAGHDLAQKIQFQEMFRPKAVLLLENIISREDPERGDPPQSARLTLTPEYLEYLITGKEFIPAFSNDFPARHISSQMTWDEIVLPDHTLEELHEIQDWLEYSDELRNDIGLGRKIKPGYKCLFTGPPGTGKTLTACLLGKTTGKDVYRIDLSMIVSKYIGETEKNLARIFDQAENRNWILFFDEADALFGKRSDTQSSHDRYANQEVSYLLQRVEDYGGLVILASNFRENIDPAFSRRFHSIIDFPAPTRTERLRLWQQSFSSQVAPGESIDLEKIADRYDVTGAQIMNVVHYCTLRALKRGDRVIHLKDIMSGMRKEMAKDGITLM